MRPKLTLKDLTFKPKEVPVAPPPLQPDSSKPPIATNHALPQALWCEMGKQWLRVVIDNRIGVGKRIFRIELYDSSREKRLAVFRRQTEAHRQ
jgi:hypothetical protein